MNNLAIFSILGFTFYALIIFTLCKTIHWIYLIKKNSDTSKSYLKIQTRVLLEMAKKQDIEVKIDKEYRHHFVDWWNISMLISETDLKVYLGNPEALTIKIQLSLTTKWFAIQMIS